MRNLEQMRAAAALKFYKDSPESLSGEEGGDVVRGLSSLIINNGLLATLAFAKEKETKNKESGHAKLMNEICRFLAEERLVGKKGENIGEYIKGLCEKDSATLQRATTEALAYLSYLKRFAPRKKEKGTIHDNGD